MLTKQSIALSVIVVSYNTCDMTLACLESLRETATTQDLELLVVDNASSDGSADAIEKYLASKWNTEGMHARLFRLEENIGFAKANNFAAERAQGHYLLLLNPDTLVKPGAIDAIMAFAAARPEAKIWGGRTVFADDSLNPGSCWGKQTLWSLFCQVSGLSALLPNRAWCNPEGYAGWKRDTVRQVDIVTGCFLLIETAFWHQLGGFDTRLFMYGEDADLCLRACALGARPAITPEAEIIHYGGASEPARAGKIGRLYAGKISLMDKHWSAPARWLGRILYLGGVLWRWIAYTLAGRLSGRAQWRRTAQEWKTVWQDRKNWVKGYLSNI